MARYWVLEEDFVRWLLPKETTCIGRIPKGSNCIVKMPCKCGGEKLKFACTEETFIPELTCTLGCVVREDGKATCGCSFMSEEDIDRALFGNEAYPNGVYDPDTAKKYYEKVNSNASSIRQISRGS